MAEGSWRPSERVVAMVGCLAAKVVIAVRRQERSSGGQSC